MHKKLSWKNYGRVAIFIDVANIIYSLKDLGWKADYKKIQNYFINNSKLVDIYFYYSTRKENLGQARLIEMLVRKGFKIRIKEVKVIRIKGNNVMYKGNCDVELAIDMIDVMPSYDTGILFSGDSDFAPLIKYVQKYGKKVIAISTRGHISKEIIQAADKFMWFNWFKDDWYLA